MVAEKVEGAVERALQAFEDKQRGLPQAAMAAALIAEIRASIHALPQKEKCTDGAVKEMGMQYLGSTVLHASVHDLSRFGRAFSRRFGGEGWM